HLPPSPPHYHTLSLHDALPIFHDRPGSRAAGGRQDESDDSLLAISARRQGNPHASAIRNDCDEARTDLERPHLLRAHREAATEADRKSTRLNSSHVKISYAVFC